MTDRQRALMRSRPWPKRDAAAGASSWWAASR